MEADIIVKKMRAGFDALLMSGPQDGIKELVTMTSGQMLLMGFSGLFTRLDHDFTAMLDSTVRVQVPDLWRKVDIVQEARSYQVID